MLRSSGSLLRHSSSRRWLVPSSSLHLFGKTALSVAQSRILLLRTNESVSISSGARMIGFRAMSSSQSKHDEPITTKGKNTSDKAAADDPTKEIVLTPGEKVVVASRLGLWAGIAAFASVCAYYIAKELIPT